MRRPAERPPPVRGPSRTCWFVRAGARLRDDVMLREGATNELKEVRQRQAASSFCDPAAAGAACAAGVVDRHDERSKAVDEIHPGNPSVTPADGPQAMGAARMA